MTGKTVASGVRRTRWLPAVVVSLFALIVMADAVVIVLYGNYRNVIEEEGVSVVFIPDDGVRGDNPVDRPELEVAASGPTRTAAGDVLVESSGDRMLVRAPGELVMHFRVPDAGAHLELNYGFLDPAPDARCEVSIARVASRWGVDAIRRQTLKPGKRPCGTFRHNLADHAGWFELTLQVNPSAAEGGFEIALPKIVWD